MGRIAKILQAGNQRDLANIAIKYPLYDICRDICGSGLSIRDQEDLIRDVIIAKLTSLDIKISKDNGINLNTNWLEFVSVDTTIYQNCISKAYNQEVRSGPDKNIIDSSSSDGHSGYSGFGLGSQMGMQGMRGMQGMGTMGGMQGMRGMQGMGGMQGMRGMGMYTNPGRDDDTERLYNKRDSTEILEKTQAAVDIASAIASLFMK